MPGSIRLLQALHRIQSASALAMAFRVVDAKYAYDRALTLGAKPVQTQTGPNELEIPAIEGIGGLQIYLVDRYGQKGSIYDVDFEWLGEPDPRPHGVGLHYIDHLTHNVYRGRLNEWAAFYEKLFNFRQIPSRSSDLFGSRAEQAPSKPSLAPLPRYRPGGTSNAHHRGTSRCRPASLPAAASGLLFTATAATLMRNGDSASGRLVQSWGGFCGSTGLVEMSKLKCTASFLVSVQHGG